MALETVKVPAEMEPLFEQAQTYVKEYFSRRNESPSTGEIFISGERYILVRASSMSVEFLQFIKNIYPGLEHDDAIKAGSSILFDIAHAIGKADAKAFHKAFRKVDHLRMNIIT
jgi:hypothetical protein